MVLVLRTLVRNTQGGTPACACPRARPAPKTFEVQNCLRYTKASSAGAKETHSLLQSSREASVGSLRILEHKKEQDCSARA